MVWARVRAKLTLTLTQTLTLTLTPALSRWLRIALGLCVLLF